MGELLSARRPKLVAGPEIYNHLLGQSEQKIRDLFKPAEDEWRKFREKSPLHVIVIDEIDALCRRRGAESSANAHRDAVVNQVGGGGWAGGGRGLGKMGRRAGGQGEVGPM